MKGQRQDELRRATRMIRENKEFLRSQQVVELSYRYKVYMLNSNFTYILATTCNVMQDEDAVLVANKWWSSIHLAMRPSIISSLSAINDAGLPRPTKNCMLREMLIHAGNRLVDEKNTETHQKCWYHKR